MATPQTAAPVVLRKRSVQSDLSAAVAMVLIAIMVVAGAAIFLAGRGQGLDPETLWEALQKGLAKDPIDTLLHALALTVVAGAAVYACLTRDARRVTRLTLGPEGIEYVFPAPEWIPYVTRKWFIPWGGLKHIELNTTHAVVTLHDGNHRRVLRILEWVAAVADGAVPAQGLFGAKLPLTLKARRALIDEAPLMRALRERGINPAGAAGDTVSNYDLFSSPAVRYVLIAMAVLGVYVLADGFLLEETWPNDPPYTALGMIGAVSAMFVILVLFLKKVPSSVATGVGLLAGAVLMVAGHSGLLRINLLTDTAGLKSYEYEMRRPARFYPVPDTDGLPQIELKPHALWNSQRNGSRHRFELRRGALGFYQLNTAPIHQAQRLYQEGYRSSRPAKPAS